MSKEAISGIIVNEKALLTFCIQADIFVNREWVMVSLVFVRYLASVDTIIFW